MDSYKDALDLVSNRTISLPVYGNRAHAAVTAAQWFCGHFPGETFYAVKANPSPWLLQALYCGGVRCFEVASIDEIRLVRSLFADVEIAFMHPIKSAADIAAAYHDYGVRIFALDHYDELEKILIQTNNAADLTLCLRHSVNNDQAKISLGRKFGCEGEDATALLRRMRQVAKRLGVCFHVGSQTMSPAAYIKAIDRVEQTIIRAGVIVDVLDIGGGFPVLYPGMTPPPLQDFMDAIARRFEAMLVAENCALWCEPGRALSAEAQSLIVKVEARRGDTLYLNDGVYGSLFDAGHLGWLYPVRRIGVGDKPREVTAYSFFGPTCDDLDFMKGPFYLPSDIQPRDLLEVSTIGAYGQAIRTGFNGLHAYEEVALRDAPVASIYRRQDSIIIPATSSEIAHV